MCGIGALLSQQNQGGTQDGDTLLKITEVLSNRGPDKVNHTIINDRLVLVGAVLHIQGSEITQQPVIDASSGNSLLWNGEVFGGQLDIPEGVSDTSIVMNSLTALNLVASDSPASSMERIMATLSMIQGPYAFIFYCASQHRLYYGRDPFGRRSLVTCTQESTLMSISSCCYANEKDKIVWEEVPISGIFAVAVDESSVDITQRQHQPWPSTCLRLNRPLQDFAGISPKDADLSQLSSHFLTLVRQSLYKRVSRLSPSFSLQSILPPSQQRCFVGVLFSGGIDSLLLAAMLHVTMAETNNAPIELINIAFDFRDAQGKPSAAPDRLAGIAGMFALKRLFPEREWRFIEIDVTQEERVTAETRIKELIQPLSTHMDLNIGTAFWFASRGQGLLKTYDPSAEDILYQQTNEEDRPLLRLGEEGYLRGDGRPLLSENSAKEAHAVGTINESMPTSQEEAAAHDSTREAEVCPEDVVIETKAPHWCRKPGCKRPTKRVCPGHLCGQCCEEHMEQDKTYKCKLHSKHKAKREGIAAKESISVVQAGDNEEENTTVTFDYHILPVLSQVTVRAECKALLVGMGADEQLAGYGRHRTVFKHGGYDALQHELNKDLTRLWQRNLGRDDRCIADHGREAWFPYLDEDLVAFIQEQPLPYLTDLTLPPGVGDKQILRQAALAIGLDKSAQLVKRAIQFGSLASKQTSVSYFGSRRKGKGTSTI